MTELNIGTLHGDVLTGDVAVLHTYGPVYLHPAAAPADFALQAPPAPPARKPKRAPRPVYDITPAQRALLALMRPLPKPERAALMDWMRREFGTSLVMDMTPAQVQRCRVQVLDLAARRGF